jgi:hypothetical protein
MGSDAWYIARGFRKVPNAAAISGKNAHGTMWAK